MQRELLFTFCAIGIMSAVMGAGDKMALEEKRIYDKIEAAYAEGVLRETIITNGQLAVKALFSTDAAVKWRALTESNFSREQIRDFFYRSGSVARFCCRERFDRRFLQSVVGCDIYHGKFCRVCKRVQ